MLAREPLSAWPDGHCPENLACVRLVGRCGFREVGLHHRHGRLDGQWRGPVTPAVSGLRWLLIGEINGGRTLTLVIEQMTPPAARAAGAGRSPKAPVLSTHRPDTEEPATQAMPYRTTGHPRRPTREPRTAAKPQAKYSQQQSTMRHTRQAHSAPTTPVSTTHMPNAIAYADSQTPYTTTTVCSKQCSTLHLGGSQQHST